MTLPMTLLEQRCSNAATAIAPPDLPALLAQVPAWQVVDGQLERRFGFKNYYQTMAFVNALAWVSHHQDHHPELVVNFKDCLVRYQTHSAGPALTLNDFICAALADGLTA